jgi:hypothetical protein
MENLPGLPLAALIKLTGTILDGIDVAYNSPGGELPALGQNHQYSRSLRNFPTSV